MSTTEQRPVRRATVFLGVTVGLSLLVFWGPLALFRIPTIGFTTDTRGPIWAIVLSRPEGVVNACKHSSYKKCSPSLIDDAVESR